MSDVPPEDHQWSPASWSHSLWWAHVCHTTAIRPPSSPSCGNSINISASIFKLLSDQSVLPLLRHATGKGSAFQVTYERVKATIEGFQCEPTEVFQVLPLKYRIPLKMHHLHADSLCIKNLFFFELTLTKVGHLWTFSRNTERGQATRQLPR